MGFKVCDIKEKDGCFVPVRPLTSADTLTDARKKAYGIVWNEHTIHPHTERPVRKGVFKAGEFIGKVTWCIRCEKVLWNEGKNWYALTKSGKLGKRVY